MKPVIICFACSFLILQHIKSQDSLKIEQAKTHQALLARITFSETQSMKAHIMNIKDSSVFVYQKVSGKPDPFHKTNIYAESKWDSYNYRFIQSVKVHNKKIRSWLLPVSIVGGIVAGALIGYAASTNNGGIEDDLNQAAGIVLGGFLGGGVGTVTGLIICSASDKKYMINGDWKSFEEMQKSMNY
jgi:Na+-translocating ferredoxin:NAD+ oxidoreductase RnfD subunit